MCMQACHIDLLLELISWPVHLHYEELTIYSWCYSAVVLLLFMLIYYVDTLMSDLLSGMESRTELQKSLLSLEGSN